jgi:hypothetical protein
MKLLLGAAVALASTLLVPTSAQAGAPTTHRAAQTHLSYLAGTTLYTPSGRVIHIHLPKSAGGYAELFGRSADGWVVQGGNGTYYDVQKTGSARRFGQGDWSDLYVTRVLAADGGSMWDSVPDQADDVSVFASAVDGHRIRGANYYDGELQVVLGAAGDHAWLGGKHFYLLGDDGHTTVVDPRGASLVDVKKDLVFLREPHGLLGPTSLSQPGALSWTVKGFQPWAVSSDGTYVVGKGAAKTAVVRRMTDGSLVRTLPVPFLAGEGFELGWGDASTVLLTVPAAHGYKSGLEACPAVSGSCALVGPYTTKGYSIADSRHEIF